MQTENDSLGVVESLQCVSGILRRGDGAPCAMVEIGGSVGADEPLSAQQQLWGELLILVEQTFAELQVTEDAATEQIAAGTRPQVVV